MSRWFDSGPVRVAVMFLLDALLATAALFFALALRFEFQTIPAVQVHNAFRALPVLLAIRALATLLGNVYRWSFRHAGLHEAARLALTTALGTGALIAVLFFFHLSLPRSVIALEYFFTTAMMATYRFLPRVAMSYYANLSHAQQQGSQRTIIVGTGTAGGNLLRDLLAADNHSYNVVGFVDVSARMVGTSVGGKTVLGTVDDLPRLIEKHRVAKVLIAIPNFGAQDVRALLGRCSKLKVTFKIIPASFTERDDRLTAAMLADLSPEDLLPRDPVPFPVEEARRLVQGRRVLVTGGAGSIGSEIARQVASHNPDRLILLDMNENELYLLTRRLEEKHPNLKIDAVIADIRDRERMHQVGVRYRPQDVFHAAAHKHVPLMEHSPEEAVKNNIIGTLNVARMADGCGAEKFVLISSDKAVAPSSVMGCSKRIAELVVRDLARTSKTKFTAVRFGNVLGSAGSVVPIFREQISRRAPITVTHPECTRYFMTIPEAVGLVLLAGLGAYGELCVLDMGEAIRIADLARNMITMAGLVPEDDVPIVYTGLRPGEKLKEDLLTEEEEQRRVARDKIFVVEKSTLPPDDFARHLDRLREAAAVGDRDVIYNLFRSIVPSYRPQVTITPPASEPKPHIRPVTLN